MIFQVVLVTTQVVTIESEDEAEAKRTAKQLRDDCAAHCHHGEEVSVVSVHAVPTREAIVESDNKEILEFTPPVKES